MKYIITDKNMPSTNGVRDIPLFTNEATRDFWVQDNLFIDTTQTLSQRFENAKVHMTQILNIQLTTIEVPYTKQLSERNYVIVEDNIKDGYLFYIIEDKEIIENSNMVILTLKLDSLITYWNLPTLLQNIQISQGHIPFENYFDYQFDVKDKYVSDTVVLDREYDYVNDNETKEQDLTYVVYRKLKSEEKGAIINGIQVPYKIYIAPSNTKLLPTFNEDEDSFKQTISKDDLISHFNELADGLTYKINILPTTFFKWGGAGWINITPSDRFLAVQPKDKSYYLCELKNLTTNNDLFKQGNEFRIRTTDLDISTTGSNMFNLLPGVEDSQLTQLGVIDFDWRGSAFKKDLLDGGKLNLLVNSYPTPNECKNFIKWDFEDIYINNDSNVWDNTTELAVYTNQLNEYKAGDPVGSKLDWLNPIKAAGVGAAAGSIIPGIGTAIGAGVGGAVGFVNSGAKLLTGRMSKKKVPNSVEGDANTYFLLANVNDALKIALKEYTYFGNERDSIFQALYRFGGVWETPYFAYTFEDVKRDRFNFMRLDTFEDSNLTQELPNEVIDGLREYFASGVRFWEITHFLSYSQFLDGNGDAIDE